MKNKRSKSTIILVFVFFLGLAILLYPTISNYWNQLNASRAVIDYTEKVEKLTKEEIETMKEEANAYNKQFVGKFPEFVDGPVEDEHYRSLVNVTGDGMIGHVTIESLGVSLPFYHGTSDRTLATAGGHLEGSSLPVGGEDTHAVITSHRGLPAAKLFTDLDQMEVGDQFYLTVLDEAMYYEVDDIRIILPEEVEHLSIISDEEYVTLFTCTPYAVNTHRLLVRGKRVDSPEEGLRINDEAVKIDPIIVAIFMGIPILMIVFTIILLTPKIKNEQPIQLERSSNHDKES